MKIVYINPFGEIIVLSLFSSMCIPTMARKQQCDFHLRCDFLGFKSFIWTEESVRHRKINDITGG